MGEPLGENLLKWLKTFQDPREAVKKEVAAIRESPFVPEKTIIHGLVYDLPTGDIEVVVDGYTYAVGGVLNSGAPACD
jgi:carbonic anhydrase